MAGDIGAARLLLERTIAPLKAVEQACPAGAARRYAGRRQLPGRRVTSRRNVTRP